MKKWAFLAGTQFFLIFCSVSSFAQNSTREYSGVKLGCGDVTAFRGVDVIVPKNSTELTESWISDLNGEDFQGTCRLLTGSGSKTWIHCNFNHGEYQVQVQFPDSKGVIHAAISPRVGNVDYLTCKPIRN